jgi:hypothetical protein
MSEIDKSCNFCYNLFMANELPPNPDQEGPEDPFSTPQAEAELAYIALDIALKHWEQDHPNATWVEVRAALDAFIVRIMERDMDKPADGPDQPSA